MARSSAVCATSLGRRASLWASAWLARTRLVWSTWWLWHGHAIQRTSLTGMGLTSLASRPTGIEVLWWKPVERIGEAAHPGPM
eukprot:3316125-Amphidinium_carterae.1